MSDEPDGDYHEPDDPPSLDPGAAYFLEEPELIRVRNQFLEAVRSEAPEVLVALRDEVLPLVQSRRNRPVDPVTRWAGHYHLCRDEVRSAGDWLVRAARDTLDHWANSPEEFDPPRWSPTAALPNSAALPDHLFARSRMSSRAFRFEAPAWDLGVETRRQYEGRARREFEGWLKAELDRMENASRTEAPRTPPRGTSDRHFKWLVQYQVKGRSYNEIADEDGIKKQTVAREVKRLAGLLIGEPWRDWLRPALPGGTPPAGPRPSASP